MSATQVAAEKLVTAMEQEVQQYLQSVMQAVNEAPDGAWIAGSEEQVGNLSAEFRRQVFEKAMQLRLDAAEAAFPPPHHPATGKRLANKSRQGRSVLTMNGRIRLSRRWWYAPQAGSVDTAFVPNTDILGLMGNMQTPLLQFPHMYYFTSTMWNLDSRQISERDTLLAVASLLYPEHRDLVADCYAGLKSSDADQIEDMANQLDPLIQQDGLGRLGVFGRKLFPDGRIVAQSLVYQLKLRSSTQRPMRLSGDTPQPKCIAAIRDCLDASLAWGQANGWPALWGKRKPALEALASDPRFAQLPVRLASCLKDVPTAEGAFNQIVAEQSQKYDSTIVEERGARWLRQEVIEALKKP